LQVDIKRGIGVGEHQWFSNDMQSKFELCTALVVVVMMMMMMIVIFWDITPHSG
jgi:hypothetical protein